MVEYATAISINVDEINLQTLEPGGTYLRLLPPYYLHGAIYGLDDESERQPGAKLVGRDSAVIDFRKTGNMLIAFEIIPV